MPQYHADGGYAAMLLCVYRMEVVSFEITFISFLYFLPSSLQEIAFVVIAPCGYPKISSARNMGDGLVVGPLCVCVSLAYFGFDDFKYGFPDEGIWLEMMSGLLV